MECAKVVRMGLEESVFTRFNDGATYEDADARGGQYGDSDEARLLAQADGSGGLSRSAAAALAAGLSIPEGRGGGWGAAPLDMNTESGREARYRREVLHSRMQHLIDNYVRVSRRAAGITNAAGENPIKVKALSIARTYVGYRREHGLKVVRQGEVAAACFQIASEMHEEPVPLAELRTLDPSLRNVEAVRREVIADTKMAETEAALSRTMGPNLLRFYLRLLQVQMSRFEEPTRLLLDTLNNAVNGGGWARQHAELMQLIEAERVFAAVLLARTEPSITWEGKPHYDSAKEPPPTTVYASFAASAHLNAQRVTKVMQMVLMALPGIRADFAERMRLVEEKKKAAAAAAKAEDGVGVGSTKPLSGTKRERSP